MSSVELIFDDEDTNDMDVSENNTSLGQLPEGSSRFNGLSTVSIVETIDLISSDEEMPVNENVKQNRLNIIKNIFNNQAHINNKSDIKAPCSSPLAVPTSQHKSRIMEGVNIYLPVEPYLSQIQIMSRVVRAIKKKEKCLVESPTGTGKTLALLCAALAWQKKEKESIANEFMQVNNIKSASQHITSPSKSNMSFTEAYTLLQKQANVGEKSIYDKAENNGGSFLNIEKQEKNAHPPKDVTEDNPNLVRIHKKPRLNDNGYNLPSTSKNQEQPGPSTPQKSTGVMSPQMENFKIRISMEMFCRQPTIYYGARTHKQLQQVVKEFSRTAYCGDATMTILSSRNNSCIRDFDRQQWSSRNDMCRSCIKPMRRTADTLNNTSTNSKNESNCKYYDNREALNYDTLPDAFDLMDIKCKGEEITACPYYAARAMMKSADIVFCPYNYLIEPSIRKNMQITLDNNVVIIDEGHNIEDICREAASLTFTIEDVEKAIKELKYAASLRFSNNENINHIETLQKALENWEQWFENQIPLLENAPKNEKNATYAWEVATFIETLNNHSIGPKDYTSFDRNVSVFNRKLRDNPDTLVGVTQPTATLLETLNIVLGYIFHKHTDDYKPILELKIKDRLIDDSTWKNLQYNKSSNRESLTLRLICLNPAIVFSQLLTARTVILASGTLAPIDSLELELGTEFKFKVNTKHVISDNRVWVGTVTKFQQADLQCSYAYTKLDSVKDALGRAVKDVCSVTPHGVLCFLPSYSLLSILTKQWKKTGLWRKLEKLKKVIVESSNTRDHDTNMEKFKRGAESGPGALLLAVFRGKAAEGMDFKDRQARAVIIVGIPYPNLKDQAVLAKKKYNDEKKYSNTNLLSGDNWYSIQAYRALNQAVGRCVRHARDWGAVILLDSRFAQEAHTKHLPQWVMSNLKQSNCDVESLAEESSGLKIFMEGMMRTEEFESL